MQARRADRFRAGGSVRARGAFRAFVTVS